MQRQGTHQEVSTTCPDCGQVLIRPVEFSAERLMYLHQKWGSCFPMGRRADEALSPPLGAEEPGQRSAAG